MSREAMKLALEALEAITVDVKTTPTAYEAQRQAITALREALAEQPAQQCKWPTCQNEEYQQALAEQIKRELVGEQPAPAQGPAAYMYASIAGPVILHRLEQIGVAKDWCVEAQLANDMKAAKRYPKAHSCTPLYTTPQTAQQEPLTLQELEAAWNAQADKFNQWDELGLDEIVAWAQAVHGIKENT